jgi:hypothetical protein
MRVKTWLALPAAAAVAGMIAVATPAVAAPATPARPAAVAPAKALPYNWGPYIARYDNYSGGDFIDYDVNVAPRTADAVAEAAEKALARHIYKPARVIAFILTSLEGLGIHGHLAHAIVGIFAIVFGALAFKAFARKLAAVILWVKGKAKGKGSVEGLRFDWQRAELVGGGYTYLWIGITARKCNGPKLRCGGPGVLGWRYVVPGHEKPPVHELDGICNPDNGPYCTMN